MQFITHNNTTFVQVKHSNKSIRATTKKKQKTLEVLEGCCFPREGHASVHSVLRERQGEKNQTTGL